MNQLQEHEMRITRLETQMVGIEKQEEKDAETTETLFKKIDNLSRLIYIGVGGIIMLEFILNLVKK